MILILSILVGFVSTIIITLWMKDIFKSSGIVGIDQQKRKKPVLPTSGGVCLMFGILIGVLSYLFFNKFLVGDVIDISIVLVLLVSAFIGVFIGLLDDIHTDRKHEQKGEIQIRKGLKQWQKPVLTLLISIPFVALGLGSYQMSFPIMGTIDFGILYPLIIIPLAVIFVTNAQNMLAGTNGLESGLGFVSFMALGIFSLINNQIEVAVIAIITSISCLGFLIFNWYPAKILPGDSLTYLLGALFAGIIIAGNMEKFGVILFAPYIIEWILKARKKFSARSLGKISKDGILKSPYGKKIYSLNHLFMRFNMNEWQISLSIILLEVGFISLGFVLLGLGL